MLMTRQAAADATGLTGQGCKRAERQQQQTDGQLRDKQISSVRGGRARICSAICIPYVWALVASARTCCGGGWLIIDRPRKDSQPIIR